MVIPAIMERNTNGRGLRVWRDASLPSMSTRTVDHIPVKRITPMPMLQGGCHAWPVPDAMLSSLIACSSLVVATNCRLKSGLKLGADRPARYGRSHVNASELSHECLPHSLAAFFEKPGADRELPGSRSEPASPCAHVGQQGDKLNRRFREAVNRLLFVGWGNFAEGSAVAILANSARASQTDRRGMDQACHFPMPLRVAPHASKLRSGKIAGCDRDPSPCSCRRADAQFT